MKFKKYMSLTNHYQQNSIDTMLKYHPDLATETYIIQEKINGQNFQILFQPNKKYKIGNRHGYTSTFNDIDLTVNMYNNELNRVQEYCDSHDITIRMYGKHYGSDIQRSAVYYGEEKDIKFFDVRVNERVITPFEMEFLFNDLDITHLHIEVLGLINGLTNALNYNQDVTSFYGDLNQSGNRNMVEGVVIKPHTYKYESPEGSVFYIKMKNKLFGEKTKNLEKLKQGEHPLFPEFKCYINENRVKSVFSKECVITQKKERGKYIQLTIKDAIEEFVLEFPEFEDMDKKEKKRIINVGSIIMPILDKYL